MQKLKLVLALQACAFLVTACGGGSGDSADTAASTSSTSSQAFASATNGAATDSTEATTTATTTSPSTATNSSSTVATTTTAATATTGKTTAATTTTGKTTSTATSATSTVSLQWTTPVANANVKGALAVKLTGQAFKNVEVFNGGNKVATATVSSDSTSATATIDTTQFANGALALTAHAWNSVAGAEYTSDADAGTLNVVVSNTTSSAAVATATAAVATTSSASTGTLMGVNIHAGGGNTTDNQTIANILSSRNLKTARMDFGLGGDLNMFRDQVTRLKAVGVKAEASLQTSYQWDYSCNQNFTAVEQDAYTQTVTMIQQIGDLIQDFELLNEVMLRPDTSGQVAPFQATPASGYSGKSCYSTLAVVLRGMGRAIADQRTASGRPYRSILGTVSNNFGFLDFMQQQGVPFDVVGYHVYPSLSGPAIAIDPWYGVGGPLAQLAKYNKPVHINEFNCGEIYTSAFDNVAGSGMTGTCEASIQKHLTSLMTQKLVNLESVHAYELVDEASKAAPENHFGLMYDLNTPKLPLALYSAFAGGTVSTAEKASLSALNLSGL